MKEILKKSIILSLFIFSNTFAVPSEIREIKTLDQIVNEASSKPTSKPENLSGELMPLEKLQENQQESVMDKEPLNEDTIKDEIINEAITNENSNEISEELTPMEKALARTDIRRIDLSEKTYGNDELVYVKGENKPFTGEFALFLGDVIESSESYVNGKLNGDKIWYSDDGNIAMIEPYKDDKLEGDQKTFFRDGKLKSSITYKNNRIVAIEVYNEEGTLLHKDDLSKGNGQWKTFWNNGQVMEEGRYKNWVKDGTWKRYQQDGTVDSVAVYENGRLKSQSWN